MYRREISRTLIKFKEKEEMSDYKAGLIPDGGAQPL
jgi:hypothetical protein